MTWMTENLHRPFLSAGFFQCFPNWVSSSVVTLHHLTIFFQAVVNVQVTPCPRVVGLCTWWAFGGVRTAPLSLTCIALRAVKLHPFIDCILSRTVCTGTAANELVFNVLSLVSQWWNSGCWQEASFTAPANEDKMKIPLQIPIGSELYSTRSRPTLVLKICFHEWRQSQTKAPHT